MKQIFCILLLLLSWPAQAYFEWNSNCQQAYTEIVQLKFRHGKDLIEQEKQQNPNNKIPYLLEDYIDFLQLQIGEETNDFKRLEPNKNKRLEILKEGDESSPWFLYSQAELLIHWAANHIKFGDYLTAAYELNKAYRLLEKNKKLHPHFIPNMKSLGVLHAMIGSVPSSYSWILSAVGIEGSIEQGMNEMQAVIDTAKADPQFAHLLDETYFMYSFLKMNLQNDPAGMRDILNNIKESDNLLLNFAANRLATKLGDNKLAIKILENRKQTSAHYPFWYLEYLLGVGKQNQLHPKAVEHFETYVNEFKGKNYLKAAYMRISWHYLLRGDIDNFKLSQSNIHFYGSTSIGEDKVAQNAFEKRRQPRVELLQARLLFDGGYYSQAQQVMDNTPNPMLFSNAQDILEYFYRYGRILDELDHFSAAQENYLKTIELGRNSSYYYAAKSALQLGLLWEEKGNSSKAHYYFNECIQMKDHEYEQSLEQKAKAGIDRLSH